MKGNKHNYVLRKKRFLGFNKDGKKIYKTKPRKNNKSKVGGWGTRDWGTPDWIRNLRFTHSNDHRNRQTELMKERMERERKNISFIPTQYDRDPNGDLTREGVNQMRIAQSNMQVTGPNQYGTYQKELKRPFKKEKTLEEFYGNFHNELKQNKGLNNLSEEDALRRLAFEAHSKLQKQKEEEEETQRESRNREYIREKSDSYNWPKVQRKKEEAVSEERRKKEEQKKWDDFTKSVKDIPTNIKTFGENTIDEIGKLPTTIVDNTIGKHSIFTNFKKFFTPSTSNGGKKRIPKETIQKKRIPKETVQKKRIPKETVQKKRVPKEVNKVKKLKKLTK